MTAERLSLGSLNLLSRAYTSALIQILLKLIGNSTRPAPQSKQGPRARNPPATPVHFHNGTGLDTAFGTQWSSWVFLRQARRGKRSTMSKSSIPPLPEMLGLQVRPGFHAPVPAEGQEQRQPPTKDHSGLRIPHSHAT
jgi:hypothetical protein